MTRKEFLKALNNEISKIDLSETKIDKIVATNLNVRDCVTKINELCFTVDFEWEKTLKSGKEFSRVETIAMYGVFEEDVIKDFCLLIDTNRKWSWG